MKSIWIHYKFQNIIIFSLPCYQVTEDLSVSIWLRTEFLHLREFSGRKDCEFRKYSAFSKACVVAACICCENLLKETISPEDKYHFRKMCWFISREVEWSQGCPQFEIWGQLGIEAWFWRALPPATPCQKWRLTKVGKVKPGSPLELTAEWAPNKNPLSIAHTALISWVEIS